MDFADIECSTGVAEKLQQKHGVDPDEVAEVLHGHPLVTTGPGGLYFAYGQTYTGRYLLALLRPLGGPRWKIVTARDMTPDERRRYHRQ